MIGADKYYIRPAEDPDAEEIAALHIACWRDTYAHIVTKEFLDSMSGKEITDRIRTKYMCEGAEFFVAVSETTGAISGFSVGGKNREPEFEYDAEVYMLYVGLAHRGRGVGKMLINSVTRKLAECGYSSLLIWTFSHNPYIRFYESLGGRDAFSGTVTVGGRECASVHFAWDDINIIISKTQHIIR